MNLDFLNNVTLDVPVSAPKAKKGSKFSLPIEADLRVYANGRVYPSKAFAEKYDLEYSTRIETEDNKLIPAGNGLDIFKGSEWEMIKAHLPEGQDVLFIAVVPKAEAKVDLFGSCRYEDDGAPKSSVFTQGSSVFAKTKLVQIISDVLNVTWEAVEYVDLVVSEEHTVKSPNNVYYLPKTITSGARKGQDDVARRENITVNALVLANNHAPIVETTEAPQLDDTATTEKADVEDWAANLQQ